MKILVVGGSGYIGSRLCAALAENGWARPVSASWRRGTPGVASVRADTTNPASLARVLRDVDAVVNCVAGSAHSISDGARVLAQACVAAGCPRIVHLSSMAVYGSAEGTLHERAAVDPSLGWYARAKCEAERHIAGFAVAGGTAVNLRPGCVWGPGSQLWVGRIARYLRARRLGDLGAGGDGWSNLVHVDDVCKAVMAALAMEQPASTVRCYNLAAPDSPRWNQYFVDLALAIGATPVARISPWRLCTDAWLGGPALKLAQSALAGSGRLARKVPDPLPPGLVNLWNRQLRMDSQAAQHDLGIAWTPYAKGLEQSAQWYLTDENHVQ
jgi:nucleoside-diphosphate-sugar epimerase